MIRSIKPDASPFGLISAFKSTFSVLCICLFLPLGCGTSDEIQSAPNAVDGASSTADAGASAPTPDLSDEVYDDSRVMQIDLVLEEKDWNTLRRQKRTWSTLFGGQCLAKPFGSPFTWFQANVTIDGELYEQIEVRKKGFLGSMDSERPSLKLDLGEYVADQAHKGVRHFTLNNSKQDPTLIRQCLAYGLFRAAGIAAPRCAYARISVNARSLGVYVLVEPIKKAFLQRNFGDASGALFEGAVSDFTDNMSATFEAKNSAAEQSSIADIVSAIDAPDDQLEEALGAVMDLEAFITYWATEVMIGHVDGYTANRNNFYLYRDKGLWRFIPWGVDAVLGPNKAFNVEALPVYWGGALAYRIYSHPDLRARYKNQLETLVKEVWNSDALIDEVKRVRTLIGPWLTEKQQGEFMQTAMTGLIAHLPLRREALLKWIEDGLPALGEPVPAPECLLKKGQISVSFTTTWGSLQAAPEGWFDGLTQMSVFFEGESLPITASVSPAGLGWDGPGILWLGFFGEGEFVTIWLQVAPDEMAPNATLKVEAIALYTDENKGIKDEFIGTVPGKLTLTSTELDKPQGIKGSFEGDILWFPDPKK